MLEREVKALHCYDLLAELPIAEGREKLAVACSVEKFFCKPLPAGYLELLEMTEETGNWPDIRLAILEFLNSGKRP